MNLKHGVLAVVLTLAAASVWAQPVPNRGSQGAGGAGMQQPPPNRAPQGDERGMPPGGQGMQPGGMQPDRQPGGQPGAMMQEEFVPPELVMRYQQAIKLTDEQRTAIRAAMQKMMTQFTDLQWKQSGEAEALAALVKQQPVDSAKALEAFDKLAATENAVKRLHFALLIEVKNTLTADQVAQLRDLQRQDRGNAPMGDRSGPGDGRRQGMQGQGGPGQGMQQGQGFGGDRRGGNRMQSGERPAPPPQDN